MAQATARPNEVRVATEIRRDEYAHLKAIAGQRRVQLAAVMRWAIEDYLAQHPTNGTR